MKTRLIGTFVFLFCSSLFVFSQSNDLSTYRWSLLDTKGEPTGRHENAFVEFQGKFYLLAGRGINPVNVFDPETSTWETRGKSPMEIHHFQPVVYGDAIYIIGAMTGRYPKETPLENIWIYYPLKDQWEMGPVIPEAHRRGGAGAVLYNDKFYLACGIEYGHTSGTNNYFDSYDPKTNTWETLTKAPHIRDHFAAVLVNDKMYCMGGRNTSVHYADYFGAFFSATEPNVDVYDFKTGNWETLKNPLPVTTAAAGVVNIGHYILYIGGEGSQGQAYNQTQCLDLNTGEWAQLAPLVIGRHGSGAVVYNGDVYLAAGSPVQGGGNMNTIEKFSPNHEWQPLFDGNSLNGWEVKCVEKDKRNDFWLVDNGTILCNSLKSNEHDYVWLQSSAEYQNFELRFKFQVSREHKGNSGVQFRSRYDEGYEAKAGCKGWLDGPQADIDPNDPWRNGFIYDETRGVNRWINPALTDWQISKDDCKPARVVFYFEDQQQGWNDMLIICKGNRIKTYVNNILISDYDGEGVLNDAAHKKCQVGEKGHIAFQLHRNSQNFIRFKDIEIRELN